VNLGNLKHLGVGVALYTQDAKGFYFARKGNPLSTGRIVDYRPVASELAAMPYFDDRSVLQAAELAGTLAEPAITTANIDAQFRRTHRADYVYPYAPEPKADTSPMVTDAELRRLILNLVAEGVYEKHKCSGYGYSQSYLGYEATVDIITGVVTDPARAAKPLNKRDDLNSDGVFDNGYWTGLGYANPARR
jgi:hypothetical protein